MTKLAQEKPTSRGTSVDKSVQAKFVHKDDTFENLLRDQGLK
jgi:hypothetical protein